MTDTGREERWEKYGIPVQLRDHQTDPHVLIFVHTSQEAAEVSAEVSREIYGHPSTVEKREVWVTVTDIRPAIAELNKNKEYQ